MNNLISIVVRNNFKNGTIELVLPEEEDEDIYEMDYVAALELSSQLIEKVINERWGNCNEPDETDDSED